MTAETPDAAAFPGEVGIVYTYNDSGQPLTMTDATGVTAYTYDERGRMLTKTNPLGTLTYTYDASSNLESVQSSNADGVSLSYGYDALNREGFTFMIRSRNAA